MKRIETELWKPNPDNPRQLKYAGQRTAQEVFAELHHRLDSVGYLPDDYFILDSHWKKGQEIPKDASVFCAADYGGSEGIYLDVRLRWYDERLKKTVTRSLATGKTLGESGADMDRTHLISSAVVKAFHSDDEHARYIRLGEPEAEGGTVLHLTGEEQQLLVDSLVSWRSMALNGARETEQLLRRMTGSVIDFVNEVGTRPMWISDYDRAVLAIQDGEPDLLQKARQKIPDRIGDLLAVAAGRPGRVGMDMTLALIQDAKDLPQDLYLTACKNAVATGDSVRTAALAYYAEECVKDLDQAIYGEIICKAMPEHKHIAEALVKQCTQKQLAAADPRLLAEALRQGDLNMAQKLIESGIDANANAAENIRALAWSTNNRYYFKHMLEAGMKIDNGNYAAMYACLDTDNPEAAKLLLDQGMDFDAFTEWAEGRVTIKPSKTLDVVREHWESRGLEPELTQTMGGV
jgi:hypothetical protein